MRRWISLVESASRAPTLTFPELYHVGSLNAEEKGNDSYEGAGLSVSVHPNAWRRIARIGGETWKVTKAGNQFLNYHETTPEQHAEMVKWAVKQGYAEPTTYWSVSYYDDEWDEERVFYCDSREEAEEEAEGYDTDQIEEHPNKLRGTEKLMQRCKVNKSHMQHPDHLIATVFADDVLGLDGVWWEDTFDPSRLSAPRGVIFPDKVASFHFEKAEQAFDASDEDDGY